MSYKRLIQECPPRQVEDGKPVFGTFRGHPERLDIRWLDRPYLNIPVPKWISNLRIKSRLSFYFSIGEYIGCIEFIDAKIFGFAEITFWNMSTKQKFSYHSIMGPRRRFVPHRLTFAATACYKKKRYIRISWDRFHDRLSVIFNLHGDSVRPQVNAAFKAQFKTEQTAELTMVLPAPTLRRCSARYYASLPLHGAITLTGKNQEPKTMPDADGSCFFDMNRTYMKFITHGELVTGLGTVDGKNISFRIDAGSLDAFDQDTYNGNALFYDGKETALPPVVITHTYGIMNKWNIQDTENMIDLTFTPVSDNVSIINPLVVRAEYHTIYGLFNGVLVDDDGNKIVIDSLPGITKKYVIRL